MLASRESINLFLTAKYFILVNLNNQRKEKLKRMSPVQAVSLKGNRVWFNILKIL